MDMNEMILPRLRVKTPGGRCLIIIGTEGGTARRPAGPGRHGPPVQAVPTGSWPRPFAKKIALHRQLANLLIQRGHQGFVHRGAVGRPAVAQGKKRRRSVRQGLLPFFQAWIWLAWTRNPLDNSATVPSSRTAASATFDLNSGPCFFRVLVMSHLRPDGRSKGRLALSDLSSFRGPPQGKRGAATAAIHDSPRAHRFAVFTKNLMINCLYIGYY